MSFLLRTLFVVLSAVVLAGCSTIYRTTGWFAYDLTEEYAIPHTLKTDDMDMACQMTAAMLPVLYAFTELTHAPNNDATGMQMLTGGCAERQAIEETLSYVRALQQQRTDEAKDARVRQKRAYVISTQRQYAAYRHMVAEYGEPGETCPELSQDDELYWVLGNLAGMQSVLSDLRSQNAVNVPKDVVMKTARGMQCVDNQRWWGLPQAFQATVWIMLPGTAPNGRDPWQELEKAGAIAAAAGVRPVHAIEVLLADGNDDDDRLRKAIRRHGESLKAQASNSRYRLIDLLATMQVQGVSDRVWTENTGSRTPFGKLGTFWDDVQAEPAKTINIDDLLAP